MTVKVDSACLSLAKKGHYPDVQHGTPLCVFGEKKLVACWHAQGQRQSERFRMPAPPSNPPPFHRRPPSSLDKSQFH
eukprot:scaffold159467_cov27-Tisochrysis_lutea.AAC.1